MSGKRWAELSPRQRKFLVVAGIVDSVLKAVALTDLARRPAAQVRGPKPLWGIVLGISNSLGVAPLIYWVFGRKTS
ncbi:hypothetical protein [Kribbella sp. NPDC003557]|uniref:hypothetical protein n=1 Tax=Kribbella sp. NPDC003557 TaxID=3154449 RepID=UPI0033B9D19A